MHPDYGNLDVASVAPSYHRFFHQLGVVMQQTRGLNDMATLSLPGLLTARADLFKDVTPRNYCMPLGESVFGYENEEIAKMGRAMRTAVNRFASSTKAVFVLAGWNEVDIATLFAGLKHDMKNVEGLVAEYQMVWARRV